jgi:hypothetical protein
MGAKGDERSRSGAPIHRYGARTRGYQVAEGDDETVLAIGNHIEKHIGPVTQVWHEIISDLVHLDVSHIGPSQGRDHHTFITSGMSDQPMTVPEGAEAFDRAELMLCLPASWKVDEDAFKNDENYWPIWWLKRLARFPHEYQTWLGWGHTVPNGDPPRPFTKSTDLCCMLLLQPVLTPEAFSQLHVRGTTINFYAVLPLYAEEMQLKLNAGTNALLDLFDEHGVTEVLEVDRPNVAVYADFEKK